MPELSVILPTYNERGNVPAMVNALANVLNGIDYEVIIVDDDSDDGTASLGRHLAQSNPRVRIIQRIHRRGLASACVEGMLSSSAPFIAVMDADMQHDERILPTMLDLMRRESLDVVVGSRHVEGGSMGAFAKKRVALSDAGRYLANLVGKLPVIDSMSGYFMVSRAYLDEVAHSLSCKGFKILLDLLLSSSRPVRVKEVPYVFRSRLQGESKLEPLVALEYLELLIDKALGQWIPTLYVIFALIGTLGLICHLSLVYLLIHFIGSPLATAQLTSSLVIIAVNFVLNNQLTFRAVRLKGVRMLAGLAMFYTACLIGLIANVQFAKYLNSFGVPWYAASLAGIIIGSVWNFGVSRVAVWRIRRPHISRGPQTQPAESHVAAKAMRNNNN
jgi:dolichol-phosphate mannosyltransferase